MCGKRNGAAECPDPQDDPFATLARSPRLAELLAAGDTAAWRAVAVILLRRYPGAYGERPQPPDPILTLRVEARVAAYAERHEAGCSLWHPDDVQPRRADGVALTGHRARNGAVLQDDLIASGEEECPTC